MLNILSPDGFRWGHSIGMFRSFSLEGVAKIVVKGLIFPFRGIDKVAFGVEVDACFFRLKPDISSSLTFLRNGTGAVLVAGFIFKEATNTALLVFLLEPPRSLSTESFLSVGSNIDWLRRGDFFCAMEAILSFDNLRRGGNERVFRNDVLSEIGEHSFSQFVRLISAFLATLMAANTSGSPVPLLELKEAQDDGRIILALSLTNICIVASPESTLC
jgi:hypothetical protein